MKNKMLQKKDSLAGTVTSTIRLSEDIWLFVQQQKIAQKRSMNMIIEECIDRYKKKFERGLTE